MMLACMPEACKPVGRTVRLNDVYFTINQYLITTVFMRKIIRNFNGLIT